MRKLLTIALSLVATSALSAAMRFDPPNPTSRTPVTMHTIVPFSCPPTTTSVSRDGQTITIIAKPTQACPPRPAGGADWPLTVDLGVLPAGVYTVFVYPPDQITTPPLFVQGTLAVADADPPLVVQPNVVPVGGGKVTITLEKPDSCVLIDPCPPVLVRFGAITATDVKAVDFGTLTATAPPHLAGVVDVTVQQVTTQTATAAFDYYDGNAERDPAFFEPVLFPVAISGPGAFGSQWQTEVALHNGNSFPFVDASGLFNVACFPVCDARPQADESVIIRSAGLPQGMVDFVSRQAMANANFSAIVRDLSRSATDFGTSIPVVRESDFHDGAFTMVNVPADGRYRVALRLYAYDAVPAPVVKIDSIAQSPAKVLVLRALPMQKAAAGTHAFGYVGDLLTADPELVGKGPLRIEISHGEPARIWGFVSITNNDTQHVTVIAPQ